jgi:hypothetical protein
MTNRKSHTTKDRQHNGQKKKTYYQEGQTTQLPKEKKSYYQGQTTQWPKEIVILPRTDNTMAKTKSHTTKKDRQHNGQKK